LISQNLKRWLIFHSVFSTCEFRPQCGEHATVVGMLQKFLDFLDCLVLIIAIGCRLARFALQP
jgi:hypothetical protein